MREVIDIGFVLKTRDYKDYDSIVTIYFKEYGKMNLIAKGIKRIKSKNSVSCLPCHLIEFTFIPKKGLSSLIRATNIKRYQHVEMDLMGLVYSSYFLEFLYRSEDENKPSEEHFNFIIKLHEAINNGYQPELIYSLTNAYILRTVGSGIQVDSCTKCCNTNNIIGISVINGGFVCNDCLGNFDQIFKKEILKSFRQLNKAGFEHLDLLKFNLNDLKQINFVMENFIDEYVGINFKSRKFMN